MSEFKVKISGLGQRISEEREIVNELKSLESSIRSYRTSLLFGIEYRLETTVGLMQIADKVDEYEHDVDTMRSVLVKVKDNYEKTERRICGYINDHPITWEDVLAAITTTGKGLAISALSPITGFRWLTHEILKDADPETEHKWGTLDYKFWKRSDKDKRVHGEGQYEYDPKTGEFKKVEKKDDKKSAKKEVLDSITLYSNSAKWGDSLLHFGKDGDVETDWGNYSYSADIMKAEESAAFRVSAGGVYGELGVALTALTAEAKGQLGNDNLGVYGQAQLDVGKVDASLKAGVGIWDEDGDFHPQVVVKAKAEAIAAELSGKAGVNVIGAEIGVKGSVNVGIGAHADVGIDGGKLHLDIGASMGIGASVALDVDFSKPIDAAISCAKDVGNAVGDAVNAAGDFISGGVKKAGNFFGGLLGF